MCDISPDITVLASTTRLQQRNFSPIVATTILKQRQRNFLFHLQEMQKRTLLLIALHKKVTRNLPIIFFIQNAHLQVKNIPKSQKYLRNNSFYNLLCVINHPIFASIFEKQVFIFNLTPTIQSYIMQEI